MNDGGAGGGRHRERVAQRQAELRRGDLEHVARPGRQLRGKAERGGAEHVHMQIARAPERGVFEMVVLEICDRVRHVLLARQERLVEDHRIAAQDARAALDMRGQRAEPQLRAEARRAEFRMGEEQIVDPFRHMIGELVGEAEAEAVRHAVGADHIETGDLRLLAAVEGEGGRGQRVARRHGLGPGALVEPFGLHPDAARGGLAALEPHAEHLHRVGELLGGAGVHRVARRRRAEMRQAGAAQIHPRGLGVAHRHVDRPGGEQRRQVHRLAARGQQIGKARPGRDRRLGKRVGRVQPGQQPRLRALADDHTAGFQLAQEGHGSALLSLVVDVEDHRGEQHQALDHLLVVDADAHDRHAVVHHPHDEGADDRADHLAGAARGRGAADEHRRDHVKLEPVAALRRRGVQPRGKDQPGQRGKKAHVDEGEEGQPLGLDPRELGRLGVAAERVDPPADHRVLGDKGVDQCQHCHRDQHVGQAAEGGELVAQEQQRADDDEGAQPEHVRGLAHRAITGLARAPLQPGPDDRHRGDDAERHAQQVQVALAEQRARGIGQAGREDVGDEARRQHLERHRERPDRLPVQQPQRGAAEHQHPGQRDDEGRDLPIGDPIALRRADHHAEHQRDHDRDRHRQVVFDDQHCREGTDEAHHRAHRQVDVARDDDDQHPERHDDDVAVLQEQVGDVDRAHQRARGHDLEEQHDRDQGDQQAVIAHVRFQIGLQRAAVRDGPGGLHRHFLTP
ncbi:hypothetical protein SDC9_36095 [bioreactor metagenome]|uniref:Uncharacterized protein n=1 Tax=bioreactor metagenome TaxID=1076179 RepID=A0A644VFI4_9ZZZZ